MQTRTKRQREILEFITEFIKSNGYQPSYQVIADEFGLKSKAGVAKHIAALEKKGLLSRTIENGSFRLELLPQANVEELMCEIEWLFSSNEPTRKIETQLLYVPKFILGNNSPSKFKGLIVNDDALEEEHIVSNDIAIIESKTFARDREIVATFIKTEGIILRKFYREGANVHLKASNEIYESFTIPANKVKVLGIFKGLLRPFY